MYSVKGIAFLHAMALLHSFTDFFNPDYIFPGFIWAADTGH